MSDDDEESGWRVSRRTLAIIGVLVVASTVVMAATVTYPATTGATFQTDSGVAVELGYDAQIESGNPFGASDSVTLDGVTFRGQNASVILSDNSSSWTNVTNINIDSGGRVHVNPANRNGIGAAETVDELRITDVNPTAENGTEVKYSASGDATLYINNTGLSQGDGLVAVRPDSGQPIGAADVKADGSVVFDDLPSGTESLDIREGAGELEVYQETNPDELVKSDAGLTFRFFTGDDSQTVIEKRVTDGTVDTTNVPSASRVVITVNDENSNYAYRRITLNSLTEQGQIYLLNTSKQDVDSTQVNFRLDDQTGVFGPSNTVLQVRKPIRKDFDDDGSNETRYQTITGGNFGSANNFRSNLVPNTRYRLAVTNSEGSQRVLGTYTPDNRDITEVLPIGSVSISGDNEGSVYYTEASIENTSAGPVIRVKYVDESDKTESLDYEIIDKSNNDTVVAQGSGDAQYGVFQATHPVNSTDSRYRVEISGERGVEEIDQTASAGEIPPVLQAVPIDPRWLELIGYVGIVAFAGFGVIIDSRLGGAVAVAFATIFTALGVVSIPFALLSAAAGVAVMFLASTDGGGPP